MLTGAAFPRLPLPMMNNPWFWYTFTDALLLICVVRDILVTGRIHPVLLYGVPLFLLGEYGGLSLFLHPSAVWLSIGRALVA